MTDSNSMILFSVITAFVYKAIEMTLLSRCLTPKLNRVATIIIATLVSFPIKAWITTSHFNTNPFALLLYSVYAVLVMLLFKDKALNKTIVALSFIIINVLMHVIFDSFVILSHFRSDYFRGHGTVLFDLIALIILTVFTAIWTKKPKSFPANRKDFILFMILPISQLLICTIIQVFNIITSMSKPDTPPIQSERSMSLALIILCILFFMLSDAYIYHLMVRISKSTKLQDQIKYMTMRDKEIMEYYDTMEKNITQTRKIRHDLANALEIARCMAESNNPDSRQAAEKMLDSMEEELDKVTIRRYTENNLVNVIFTNKAEKCIQNGIEPDFHAILPPDVGIDKFDSTRVLTNLLDNAINAASSSETNKKVSMSIIAEGNKVTVTTRNPIGDKNLLKNDGKDHGYGLKILKDIVKKYNGSFTYKEEDGFFETEIIAFVEPK